MKRTLRIPLLLLAGSAIVLVSCAGDAESAATLGGDTEIAPATLTIFLSDTQGVMTDCAAVKAEQWTVPHPPPQDLPSAAIRRVLRDVHPSASLHRPETLPLIEYFQGVRIEDKTAVVAFDREAMEYLNSTACAQAAVKMPMVRTLLEFPNIDDVAWEVDGEIVTEWDA